MRLAFVLFLSLWLFLPSANSQLLDSTALAGQKLYLGFAESLPQADKVYKLCMGGQGTTSISPAISEFKKLQEWNISQNNLSELPSEICTLKNLTELKMSTNSLKTLPDCFSELKNLKNLELATNSSMNWTVALPIISKLENLKYLDLSYNDLTELPDCIFNLKNLKELSLDGNKFAEQVKQKIIKALPNVKITF